MNERARQVLKSYFATNALPTQDNFADLIDSFIDKTDDGITISSLNNIGFGENRPVANLTVKSRESKLSGTLSGKKDTNELTGAGTSFSRELINDQIVNIGGANYIVLSVDSDTVLKVKTTLTADLNNVIARVVNDIMSVHDLSGKMIFCITKEGNIGVQKKPGAALDINGAVKAGSFEGSATGLTNIPAANLTGAIPSAMLPPMDASRLTGTISSDQLPVISPAKTGRYIYFVIGNPVIIGEEPATLTWAATAVDSLELTYLFEGSLARFTSASKGITLQQDAYKVNLYRDTVFTLTATNGGKIVAQEQISVTIKQNANQFVKQLKYDDYPLNTILEMCGNRFNLGVLTNANLNTIAIAIKNAGFSVHNAYNFIPQYYTHLGGKWSQITDDETLGKIFGDNLPKSINDFAARFVVSDNDLPKLISQLGTNFNLQESTDFNIRLLGTAIKNTNKFTPAQIFKSVPQYYRGQKQPWNISTQGKTLENLFTN